MKKLIFTILGIGIVSAAVTLPTDPVSTILPTCDYLTPVTMGYENLDSTLALGVTKNEVATAVYTKDVETATNIYNIPDDATRRLIAVTRENWKDDGAGVNVISVVADIFDGTDWKMNVPILTSDGGVRTDNCGNPAPVSSNSAALPEGKNRQIRVRVVSKDTINTSVKVYFQNENAKTITEKIIDSIFPQIYALVRQRQTPTGSECAAATSCPVTMVGNLRPQSMIIAYTRYGATGQTVTVSDDQSNTYIGQAGSVEVSNATDASTSNVQWSTSPTKVTTATVTCAASGVATSMRCLITEVSNVSSRKDKTATATGTGTAPNTGSITPSQYGEYLYCFEGNGSAADIQVASTWTFLTRVPNTVNARIASEYMIQTTPTSAACAFTTSQTNWAAGVVSFYPTSSENPVLWVQ